MKMSIVSKLRYLLISGGLLILPLFYWPQAIISFEVPKVWFVMGWGVLVSVLMLFETVRTKTIKELDGRHLLVGIWFLILIVASFRGVDPVKSWLGNYYRWDGLITMVSLVGLFIVLSLIPQKLWFAGVVLGMALGNLVSSIWAILQVVLSNGAGFDGMGAGFGQPVFLAGYLLVTTPFVWLMVEKIKQQKLKMVVFLVVTLIVFMGLLATKALVSLICLPILLIGLLMIKGKIKWWLAIVMVALFILGAMISYNQEIKRGEFLGSGLAYEGRGRLIMKAYLAFKERPVWGWGVANFDKAFEAVDWPIKIDHDIYADKAHSNLLETVVASGVLGLGMYLLLIWHLIKRLLVRHDQEGKFLLLVLFVYLIHSQTNITSVAEEIVFWLVASSVQMK